MRKIVIKFNASNPTDDPAATQAVVAAVVGGTLAGIGRRQCDVEVQLGSEPAAAPPTVKDAMVCSKALSAIDQGLTQAHDEDAERRQQFADLMESEKQAAYVGGVTEASKGVKEFVDKLAKESAVTLIVEVAKQTALG